MDRHPHVHPAEVREALDDRLGNVELGAEGIDKIIELNLTPEEKKALNTSAADVKVMIDEVDAFLKEEG